MINIILKTTKSIRIEIYKLSLIRISQAGKKTFWIYSDKERDTKLAELEDEKKIEIQRYKGLGEMSPEQLWQTTMNPESRTLLKVGAEDAMAADWVFHMLMGNEVPPRKSFIQAHARSVKNLDI